MCRAHRQNTDDSPLVIFLALFCYFLLFAAAASLLLFAPARAATARFAERVGSELRLSALATRQRLLITPRRTIASAFAAVFGQLKGHRRLALGTLALILLPSLAVLSTRSKTVFDFGADSSQPDRHIALLLEGEQLAPPPALPPETFTTREVELVRPATAWASRDWDLLDATFRQRLLTVFKLMREQHGYDMVLLEGYRSAERQTALAAIGKQVTQAGAGMSFHQYGLAADSAFLREGALIISEKDPWAMRGYQLYGQLAAAAGLTWGGDWRMRDYGHVELQRAGVLARQDR